MKASRAALAIGAAIVVMLIAFPYLCRSVAVPVGLVSLTKAEAQMALLGNVIRDYKVEHHGRVPNSYEELSQYVRNHRDYNADVRRSIGSCDYQYYPAAEGDEPLVIKYIRYQRGKHVLLWVDRNGRAHVSRAWLWPTHPSHYP